MILLLSELRPGMQGMLEEIHAPQGLLDRLGDFGFRPGVRVRCRYQSPGRDLLAVELRGTVVALRRKDLDGIRVRLL